MEAQHQQSAHPTAPAGCSSAIHRPAPPTAAAALSAIDVEVSVRTRTPPLNTLEQLLGRHDLCRLRRTGSDDVAMQAVSGRAPGDGLHWPGASEYSSGATQKRGGSTKTGNAHLRRVLVEAAWHYRHRPAVNHRLRIRQHAAPPAAIRVAWSAQHRLHAHYRRLLARGKSPQLAVRAVARELSAFVWAALTQ